MLRLVLGCIGALSISVSIAEAESPNIVLIVADDLGYGDVGCFNPQSKIQTPHIDRLAAKGTRFTDAHSPGSSCIPSRYGMLTGRYPFRMWTSRLESTRIGGNGMPRHHFEPEMLINEPRERLNLATFLKSKGFATACFGKWHQGMELRFVDDATGDFHTTPVDFGFDYFFGIGATGRGPYAFMENKQYVSPLTYTIPEQLGDDVTNAKTQGGYRKEGQASAIWKFETCLPRIIAKSDKWLAKHAADENGKPFFLYHAIPAPHAPWTPAAEFKGKSQAGPYGDYVMTVDAMVGQIVASLSKHGFDQNTLVVFTSDNGPVWYPADVKRYGHQSAGPFRGARGSMHEGGHRVPLILTQLTETNESGGSGGRRHESQSAPQNGDSLLRPLQDQSSRKCDELVCTTDLIRTFAAVLGTEFELPSDTGVDSFNLLPYLIGKDVQTPVRKRIIHTHRGTFSLAIREGDWKLLLPSWVYTTRDKSMVPDTVVDWKGEPPSAEFQLFNLKADPGEKNNLAKQEPEKVQSLFALLKQNVERGQSR